MVQTSPVDISNSFNNGVNVREYVELKKTVGCTIKRLLGLILVPISRRYLSLKP